VNLVVLKMKPYGFSWVEEPLLAGLARPASEEELQWLRDHGIDLLISLTEEKLPKHWLDKAGLLGVHEPVVDMQPPTLTQIEKIINSILKAHQAKMGVAIHCAAGMGRTGVALASYFVAKGMEPSQAIAKIRTLRPGSVETEEQEHSIHEYSRKQRG
jgi:atypical dual specificity phosphatase